jgi:hypothetical protein
MPNGRKLFGPGGNGGEAAIAEDVELPMALTLLLEFLL